MSLFKKLLLGTAIASALLFTLPAEQAQAATVTLDKSFYYEASNGGSNWLYWDNKAYLRSEHNSENLAISFVQFLIDSSSVYANSAKPIQGQLGILLKDVIPSPLGAGGNLSIYRVNDLLVQNASSDIARDSLNSESPISLNTLLATNPIQESDENQDLLFNFSQLVNPSEINGNYYLSFAIVADVIGITTNIEAQFYPQDVSLTVDTPPVPEPMSAAYMLIGAGALVLRKARKLLGIA